MPSSNARRVLVVGGGGREHALAWRLSSDGASDVFVTPGNAGTASTPRCVNVTLDVDDFDAVVSFCRRENVDLVVVGPEGPLAKGIADALLESGLPCFGPSRLAARLEASKSFAKAFMDRHGIPTAPWKSFEKVGEALEWLDSTEHDVVVKADGLAAGKGVVVAKDKTEAASAIRAALTKSAFGAAGSVVVLETRLHGPEVSCHAFVDGRVAATLPPARDHKRLLEGDAGPNTGGMGAVAPVPLDVDLLEFIEEKIIQKTVDGMRAEGCPFVGVLYVGLMLTAEGPKVIEFNCRFGDPETQALMQILDENLLEIMKTCADGTLEKRRLRSKAGVVAAVVVASADYPRKCEGGKRILGLDEAIEAAGEAVFHAGTKEDGGNVVTNGGRVATATAIAETLDAAVDAATRLAAKIRFDGAFFRRDIGRTATASSSLTYASAGVDIAAGNRLVEAIKPFVESTRRSGCPFSSNVGRFGAFFDISACGYDDPLLVSGADGVGTKLKLATRLGRLSTIGVDLVAMSANDVLVHGAEPLFFLDYYATGRLNVADAAAVVSGVAAGCRVAGCALVGGETAEMPGSYAAGAFDLAGFVVGAVERFKALPRKDDLVTGDVLIGLASSGCHSNGFSLLNKILEMKNIDLSQPAPWVDAENTESFGETLVTPTKIYVNPVLPLMRGGKVKAAAHITGGGLVENLPRALRPGLDARVDANAWHTPALFRWISETGGVAVDEMLRTFNCGVGFVVVVGSQDAQTVMETLKESGVEAFMMGDLVVGTGDESKVIFDGKDRLFLASKPRDSPPLIVEAKKPRISSKKKVGVLISGSGTNLQALIDHTVDPVVESDAEIVLVVSNRSDAGGLKRAADAGIPTLVISHKDFSSREDFDSAVNEALRAAGVEFVCLAGFMRILSAPFVQAWRGRLLNVHPSLLPAFKGAHAHRDVLAAGVRVSGCTVHFVVAEVDAGPILVQRVVNVGFDDTEDDLSEKVKKMEHVAYPEALELVVGGKVEMLEDGKLEWRR